MCRRPDHRIPGDFPATSAKWNGFTEMTVQESSLSRCSRKVKANIPRRSLRRYCDGTSASGVLSFSIWCLSARNARRNHNPVFLSDFSADVSWQFRQRPRCYQTLDLFTRNHDTRNTLYVHLDSSKFGRAAPPFGEWMMKLSLHTLAKWKKFSYRGECASIHA